MLKQIKSNETSKENKNYFLGVLGSIVSLQSVDTLFPLLADSELSGNASWVLRKLNGNESVCKRAIQLIRSENSYEKAAGIFIRQDYYNQNLEELEDFQKDTAVEVRWAVMNIYLANNLTDKIVEFANDPCEQIRNFVFLYFAEGANYRGSCLIASYVKGVEQGQIIVNKKCLILEDSKGVMFIPKVTIETVKITENGENAFGVYVKIAADAQTFQSMLLVPTDKLIGFPDRIAQISILSLDHQVFLKLSKITLLLMSFGREFQKT